MLGKLKMAMIGVEDIPRVGIRRVSDKKGNDLGELLLDH